MTRHRWSSRGALLCALLLALPAAAAPAPEEQDRPLAQVPAKAPLVIQLRGFERTRERLTTLIQNAMPDFAALAKQKIDEALKEGLDGRDVKGVTKDGTVFVVFTEMPAPNQNPPKMALLLPVTGYEAFRNGVLKDEERKQIKTDPLGYEIASVNNEAVYFVNRKNGYAVVTPDADVAASFTKKYDGLTGKLSKPLAQHLTDADVAVYVDMAAVNKEYGDQIKGFQAIFEQGLENLPDKNTAEQVKRIYGPIFQAVGDSTAFLASFDLRPEGVLTHLEVEVPADSKTNTYLKEWKKLAAGDLAKLPAGQMVYSSMAFTPALMKEFGSLTYGAADPDSADAKALKKEIEALSEAGPREMLTASNVPSSGLTLWKYDDPAKAVAAQLKVFKALKEGSSYGAVLKGAPVVKEGAEKQGGIEFHSVGLKFDIEKTVDKQGAAMTDEQKKAMVEYMKTLLGEGSNLWFGTDGKVMVQVVAKDWPAAQKLLDSHQKGEDTVGQSQAYKDALKHLPGHNSLVALADVPQYSEVMVKSFAAMLQATPFPFPIPPGIDKPAVKPKTTYLGVGFTLESGRGSFDLWLSAASVNDVYKMYLEKILKPNF
jgi:hypothetical protein